MLKTRSGFTIVELLIVIVVIGILAAITIVAYNGIQNRGRYVSMRSDLSSLKKAIELYYADNGQYPLSPTVSNTGGAGCRSNQWCGWQQAKGDDFIPGLVPKYISATPQRPASTDSQDSYLYRSTNGAAYKIIRLNPNSAELAAMADLTTTSADGCSESINISRWGYWSSDISKCW